MDEDVDVTGLAAERARMSFTREPDPLAVVDPGWDLDVEAALLEHSSGAGARLARVLDDLTRPAAARTRLAAEEIAETGARHALEVTGAPTVLAGRDGSPRLHSVAAARRAARGHLHRHRTCDAGRSFLELDLDLGRDVGPARSPCAGGDPEDVVAEEGGEDVREATKIGPRLDGSLRSCSPACPNRS